jgi:hypothetical protein
VRAASAHPRRSAGGEHLPWDRSRADLYRTIVPQMTLWLPDEEAARWRLDFETEMARFDDAA